MKPQKTVGPLRERRHLRNRKRGRIARENRSLRANLIQRAPQFALRRQLLDDRFDHNIAILQVLQIRRPAQASSHFVAFRLRQRAFVHQPLKILIDGLQTFFHKLRRNLSNCDLESRTRRHLGNS